MHRSSRRLFAVPLCVLLTCASSYAAADNSIDKINGSIRAEAGQSYDDLSTINGGIQLLDGAQARDISTVNGGVQVGDNASAVSLQTVNGTIRIGRQTRINGDVSTANGAIRIGERSIVNGDVQTANGAIVLTAAQVRGDVETANGDLTIGADSRIGGGLSLHGAQRWFQITPRRRATVIIGPRVVIEGPLSFRNDTDLWIHRSARTGPVEGAEARIFDGDAPPQR